MCIRDRDYTMRSVFYGSKGTIIADNTSPYLTVYTVGEEGQERIDGMERFTVPVLYPVPLNNHNTAGEIEELANAILNGQKVATCLLYTSRFLLYLPMKSRRTTFFMETSTTLKSA